MKDKLQFWHKSADKEPGKGTGEYVKNKTTYSNLKKIKDWRKKLSNEFIVKFKLGDVDNWDSINDYCSNRSDEHNYSNALKLALFDKNKQNTSLKNILLNTKSAELYYKKKNIWVLFEELMVVRNCINNYDKKYDLKNISQFEQELIANILKYPVEKQIFYAQDRVLVKYENDTINTGTIKARITFPNKSAYKYNIKFDDGVYKEYVPSEYIIEKIN